MILELIIALLCGVTAGTLTGLLPGIHINLVSAILISSSSILLTIFSPIALVIFIVSMTITHTFLDFIPSIFLGAPDEDTTLSVLPGHEFLLKGRAHEAIILTLYGGLIGIFLIITFSPIFIYIFPIIYSNLKFVMFFLLVFANVYLIFKEKKSKTTALIIFLLSGFLGLATITLPLKESLLPLLTGLFGSSSLIVSISKSQKIPKQKIILLKKLKISKKEALLSSIASVLTAPLCAFLPALGTGQAAAIGSDIIGEVKRREFLILLGTINTAIAGLSFITLYSIQKARTGTAVAVQTLLQNITLQNMMIILIIMVISAVLAFFLALFISKLLSKYISKINYRILSLSTLIFITAIVIFFSGWLGFLIFTTATFIGLFTILTGVRRTHLMGSLMLPSIIFYLPF